MVDSTVFKEGARVCHELTSDGTARACHLLVVTQNDHRWPEQDVFLEQLHLSGGFQSHLLTRLISEQRRVVWAPDRRGSGCRQVFGDFDHEHHGVFGLVAEGSADDVHGVLVSDPLQGDSIHGHQLESSLRTCASLSVKTKGRPRHEVVSGQRRSHLEHFAGGGSSSGEDLLNLHHRLNL